MTLNRFGKPLMISAAIIVLLLFAWEAFSEPVQIIEVKANIPMSDGAPFYRDLYINQGGLKKGATFYVKRKTKIHDSSRASEGEEILIPVGEVTILESLDRVSIAREKEIYNPDQSPVIDVQGVLIGDLLDPKNNYYRIQLLDFDFDYEDQLSELCFGFGSTGISEDLSFFQTDLTYDPKIAWGASKNLNIYFADEPPAELLTSLGDRFPQIRFQVFCEENQDWLVEWKKHFRPFEFVADYWIVPSWLESTTTPDKTFLIDPGMAFGTGTHATTQLCALQIYKLLSSSPAQSLLDVGTGTGVLALLAARLGVSRILGVDNDPEAVRTALQNTEINQVNFKTKIEYSEKAIEEFSETFDVVVANIIDGVLVHLFTQLLARTRAGGYLILSGILVEREDQFLDNIRKLAQNSERRLVTKLRLEKDEWASVCFQIPG